MAKVGVAWGAASTALSACLYLLDLGTTLSTLHAYFLYNYRCPHAALSSSILHDPICRKIRAGFALLSIGFEFWMCILTLVLAHLIYAFVFWTSLDPLQHPLRLAYFMPLIHLYRLLKVLRHSFSLKDLKKLQEDQAEANSLYNAVGAALEAAPQFIIQFGIAIQLGEYVKGSADENMQANAIPSNLLLSLGASVLSASYSNAIAVTSMTAKRIPLAARTCVGLVDPKHYLHCYQGPFV